MCGRYDLHHSPAIRTLFRQLGLNVDDWPVRYSADIPPASTISIIREDTDNQRRVDDAKWWLLMERQADGSHKPNYKYATFNTRWDKLNRSRSAGYSAYRHSRCLIPASGFVEGLEGTKTHHQLTGQEGIAFGGLYMRWEHEGGELLSASIITLPPHDKFKGIHEKAFPMMLDVADTDTVSAWLNPHFNEVDAFATLLQPYLPVDLQATPINRASERIPTGKAFTVAADGHHKP